MMWATHKKKKEDAYRVNLQYNKNITSGDVSQLFIPDRDVYFTCI